MPSTSDKMRVCEDDQCIVLQVEGKGTMKQAPALRARAETALAEGVHKVQVDLRHCGYMDSTFMGTLLLLKRATAELEDGEFSLISPSPDCCQLLQKMQLARIYKMVELEELPNYLWSDLPAESDEEDFDRVVVQAHQELAGMGGATGAMFAGLAERLMQEWKAKREASHGSSEPA